MAKHLGRDFPPARAPSLHLASPGPGRTPGACAGSDPESVRNLDSPKPVRRAVPGPGGVPGSQRVGSRNSVCRVGKQRPNANIDMPLLPRVYMTWEAQRKLQHEHQHARIPTGAT
jgi:hypothetical protein